MKIKNNESGAGTLRAALLTASKPELLDKDGDRMFRGLLYDYFAFSRGLDAARARFAKYADLSQTQYLILIAIVHSSQDEPMGINQIADRLYLSGAFITNEVNKLVSDGLMEKSAHPVDGRRVQLTVTERGLSLLMRLATFQRPVNDALFDVLTREEFKLLSQLLGRLAANGERAVKLAEHIEMTLRSEAAEVQPSRRKTIDLPKKKRARK
jgi:MarR family transcriptional regulator, organic hydroperoxide resistance regulator